MIKANPEFNKFLQTHSLSELTSLATSSRLKLNLPQAQQIISHAKTLGIPKASLRLGIIHTYTSDLIQPWLELEGALQGLELEVYHAPYGVTFQEAKENSALVSFQPDLTLLLLQKMDLHPDLAYPISSRSPKQQDELLQEVVQSLTRLVSQFRQFEVGQILITLLPSPSGPGLGLYDAQSDRSEAVWWGKLKAEIATAIRASLNATLFLDLDEVLYQVGRGNFFDLRYWFSAKFPFAAEASREIARRVISLGVVRKLPKAKVIVLDADNTLWGGVIGEDGLEGIALGPDYPGVAYVEFQRRLLEFQQRGFILALCSKNNPEDLDQVLTQHPQQLLKDQHFAARRVNWEPKPDNLKALAEELNLGLDSFIFVDDSHHECAAVRYALPQVEVIQTPAKPVDVPFCLDHMARLEVLNLTAEDLAKTELYAQERKRRELLENAANGVGQAGNYLDSLGMKMTISLNNPAHLARLSQLTQKTNQFNLTTRRYDESQVQNFIESENWLVADFSLADIFGDSGLVGLAIFSLTQAGKAELDTFLMSCRVIGREAESAFLHALLAKLAERGITLVIADYLPTPKNGLVKDFLPTEGFQATAEGRYQLNLAEQPPKPASAFPIALTLDV